MSGQGVKRGNEGNTGGGGGGFKKMRPDSITLRFLLQSKHAGGIIGKGGQTIKRLRSEYNATVSVPDTNAPERVLSIAAGQENAISVLKECLPLCHEPPYTISGGGGDQGSGNSNHIEVNFLVHSSQVGGIIGRAGSNIKELRESTGTNIKVFQECLANSTERVVAIGASSEDGVIDVIHKVLTIMQEQPIKGNISLYDPSMEPWDQGQGGGYGGPMHNSGGGGGGGRGGRGGMRGGGGGRGRGRGGFGAGNQGFGGGNFGQQDQGNFGGYGGGGGGGGGGSGGGGGGGGPPDNFGDYNQGGDGNFGKGNVETTQVTIPNDLAGAIIGKGGERIRNIRQRSGADIKIQDPLPGKADRVITISGNPEQIQYGQFLMQQSVRQFGKQHNT